MIIVKKPKIRFKGFTETWEQRKLGSICKITMGQSPNGSTYSETPCDYILVQGNADLKDGWVVPRIWTSQITKTAKSGDLIMSVRAPAGAIGKTAYDVVIGRGVASINGNEFIYQTLKKYEIEGYWKKIATGSTFESINSEDINDTILFVPIDDSEQKQIGSLFSKLDHLITLHQRKCENLKKLKKFMLQKLFPQNGENVPKIRFSNFTDTWEQRKLGDMGSTFTGLSGKNKNDFGHGKAKFVTYMNVFTNSIANLEMTDNIEIDNKQNEVKYGDVFFTTSSETPDEVGMSSVWLGNKQNIYLNSFCFGFRPSVKINEYYLAYMLRSDCVRKKITYLAQGISRYNISKNKMMNIEIPLTNYLEQQKIGTLFSELDNLITLHQSKCDNLKELKKYMLQNMFI